MSKLPAVHDDTFDREVLQSPQPVLVDFHATWCGPCKALAPTLEALSGDYSGKVKFLALDIDEARHTAQRFGVMAVPTMLIFQGGQVVHQMTGNRPKGEIQGVLDNLLPTRASAP